MTNHSFTNSKKNMGDDRWKSFMDIDKHELNPDLSRLNGYGYMYPMDRDNKDKHEMEILKIVPKFLYETHNYK